VWRVDVLQAAWQAVRRNGGAAGVDGETVQRIEAQGVSRWLGELARDLKEGTYRPGAVRQVLIPKKQAGKYRPLGIPCVREPVAQTAAPLVLDLALFLDLAQRAGMSGILEWLSFYFKSPMAAQGLYPEHDIFIQLMKLKNTLRWMKGEDLITHLGLEYYD